MIIFGKFLSEYVAFCKSFLILVPVIGVVRLALSLGGAPNTVARWATMTGLVWIAVVYLAVRVHTSRFGSYKQLLVLCALVNFAAQAVAIFAIALAILTGTANIYSAPEYAFGADGKNWFHVAMHAFVGTTAGSLVPWLVGSAILAVTRRVSGSSSTGDFHQVERSKS